MPRTLSLPAEVDEVCKLAMRAGLRRAERWIAEKREKEWPHRDWEYGACIWCEIDDGKRRKATCRDPSGGPYLCDRHFDELFEDDTAAPASTTKGDGDGANG